MQTAVIRRSPEWWSKSIEKKKPLSPKAQLDNRFLKVNKDLSKPIEYKDWNWERIKVIKDAEWKSISVLKAVNPDKEIIEWWDNVKSEVRLIKGKDWKYSLLSNERWSDNPSIEENQMITETSNDVWINTANEMLAKIENRISEWRKIIKGMEEAKIKRMMDLAYQNDQNDADNMIEDLMNDESIA